jgi:hypothetical protein
MERKGAKRGPYTKKANPEERNAAKKKAAPKKAVAKNERKGEPRTRGRRKGEQRTRAPKTQHVQASLCSIRVVFFWLIVCSPLSHDTALHAILRQGNTIMTMTMTMRMTMNNNNVNDNDNGNNNGSDRSDL